MVNGKEAVDQYTIIVEELKKEREGIRNEIVKLTREGGIFELGLSKLKEESDNKKTEIVGFEAICSKKFIELENELASRRLMVENKEKELKVREEDLGPKEQRLASLDDAYRIKGTDLEVKEKTLEGALALIDERLTDLVYVEDQTRELGRKVSEKLEQVRTKEVELSSATIRVAILEKETKERLESSSHQLEMTSSAREIADSLVKELERKKKAVEVREEDAEKREKAVLSREKNLIPRENLIALRELRLRKLIQEKGVNDELEKLEKEFGI